MALIQCPECKNRISDKAELCPHCGLPAIYFGSEQTSVSANNSSPQGELDYRNLGNVLISFDQDYSRLFSSERYISHRDMAQMQKAYGEYYKSLKNRMIYQYVENHASSLRIDIPALQTFLRKMHTLDGDVTAHNSAYVEKTLELEREYFDHILEKIDPNIRLDDEQRRAVITDDDHCLLVAGAGAGKTTTMAAKVKYLVERKQVNPEEIIVISYAGTIITVFSLIATLPLSFLALLIDKILKGTKEEEVSKETFVSITLDILYSMIVIGIIIVAAYCEIPAFVQKIIVGIIAFLVIKIALNILMILKRVFAIWEK